MPNKKFFYIFLVIFIGGLIIINFAAPLAVKAACQCVDIYTEQRRVTPDFSLSEYKCVGSGTECGRTAGLSCNPDNADVDCQPPATPGSPSGGTPAAPPPPSSPPPSGAPAAGQQSGGITIINGKLAIPNPLKDVDNFGQLVDRLINFFFYIAVVLAPLMVLIAAFYFLTAAGDPKRVQTAKSIITYTVIGTAVIFLAKGLIAVISQVLGVDIALPPQ